ncbi:MAG: aminofutalosine synthase MqnE [Pirellulaceae bacterium]|nr:aminofutalosine synthase MqnE [Pirellulaceae bacterium]
MPSLENIREKVASNVRLSADDGEFLLSSEADPHAVGELADVVRQRKNGDAVFYNLNLHLNPTNICVYRCAFCAYSHDLGDPRGYVMSDEAMLARGREAVEAGCTELHIVGGAHPDKPYEWYLGIIRRLHESFPTLHLKAWTAVEIDHFSRISGRSVEEVLKDMIAAGLGSMPGGGAEIFDADVRKRICPRKADADRWLEVHRTAHRLGLRTNATMLYGHVETARQRIEHLVRLRELQDGTGGFQVFVPLKFHPANTAMSDIRPTTAIDDLRTVAVSRLMLDNFEHIKAYWISLGVGPAQVALAYGADDLDGTVRHERIHHDAGSASPDKLSVERIRQLIIEAGREPVERDSLYRRIRLTAG